MKIRLTLLLVLGMLLPYLVHAKSSADGDALSLAALMIKDQHFYRAKDILEKADTQKKDFDFKRYHVLSGITDLNVERFKSSIEHFKKAIALGQDDQILYVYMSQAAYRLEDYVSVIEYLDQAPEFKAKNANLIFLKFEAYKRLNKPYLAWDTLKEGQSLFPDKGGFIKQQVFTLIELGFYQEAASLGLRYTEQFQPSVEDYIGIGLALSQANNAELAAQFLEAAKLKFPNNVDANKALANFYSGQKKYYVASLIMEPLAIQNPNLINEAAELNKLSHQYFRALFLNGRSTNQKEKLKQRLGLFLQFDEYELAALMEKDLERNKVLEDDNVRYALAYAQFKTGKFEDAEHQLSQIRNARLFNKANQIRSIMLDCQNHLWKCQ